MNIYENPHVEAAYIKRVAEYLGGPRDDTKIHLSDLQGCPLPAFYRLTTPVELQPGDDRSSILRFFRGRAVERAIATEMEPKEKDRIICTADDMHPDHGLGEIKSTMEGCEFWKPEREHPEWVERMKGYAHINDETKVNLIVYFMGGNVMNYTPWSIKQNGRVQGKYRGVEFKVWTLEFTPEELEANWAVMLERRDVLELAITHGVPPEPDYVTGLLKPWHCKLCRWRDTCYYIIEGES